MRYVVDTCIINKLVDGKLKPNQLPDDGDFIATHIQIDELNKTKETERRASLLLKFTTTVNVIVPTESTVLGVSRLGHCKLSDGNTYTSMKNQLDSLNGGKANNSQDVLIAEVATQNGYTLLTSDDHLQQVAKDHGCSVIYWPAS